MKRLSIFYLLDQLEEAPPTHRRSRDEFDLDRQSASWMKRCSCSTLVTARPGHGMKSRAAADAHLVRLLEQPLPEQGVMMPMILAYVRSVENDLQS